MFLDHENTSESKTLTNMPYTDSNSNSLSGGPQLGLTSLPNIDELACGTVDQPCSRKGELTETYS